MLVDYDKESDILNILHEAMLEGENKEVFFLDKFPETEGLVTYLEGKGYSVEFITKGNLIACVVSWSQELTEKVLQEFKNEN